MKHGYDPYTQYEMSTDMYPFARRNKKKENYYIQARGIVAVNIEELLRSEPDNQKQVVKMLIDRFQEALDYAVEAEAKQKMRMKKYQKYVIRAEDLPHHPNEYSQFYEKKWRDLGIIPPEFIPREKIKFIRKLLAQVLPEELLDTPFEDQ